MKSFLAAFCNVLLIASLTACSLTQRPPLTELSRPVPVAPISNATVGAAISLKGLGQYLETIIPAVYSDEGSETEWAEFNACWPFHCPVKTKTCDWNWYVKVTRDPFAVTPVNGGLAVTSHYRLWGRVRTHGPVCPPLQETTEPDGELDMSITVQPQISDVYGVQPNLNYAWHWTVHPGIKLWGVIPVTFAGKAGEAIDKGLSKARDKMNADLMAKLDFRASMETAWAQLHDPIPITNDGLGWLSIKPLGLNASPFVSDADYARISLSLRSRNEVIFGPKPPDQDKGDLPILRHDPSDGKFALSATASLDYAAVVNRARSEWTGKTLYLDWGRLRFEDFRAYQSGDRIVIGAKVDIMPKYLPYVYGWLYILGRPVVENDRLYLADLDYRANTNNPFVQTIAFLFKKPAKEELSRKLSFDLAGPLSEVRAKLNALEPRPIGKFGRVSLKVQDISIDTPVADAKVLRVPIRATGTLEALFLPYGE